MPTQPMTDRELARTGTKQNANGARFLGLGVAMILIGFVIIALTDGVGDFIGIAFAALGAIPTLAGIGLVASGVVSKRHAKHKSFA